MQDEVKTITANIDRLRKAKKWTAARLNREAGCHESMIRHWKTGIRHPTLWSICKIAWGLDVTALDLLTETQEMPKGETDVWL